MLMKSSESVFDCVDLLYYKFYKTNPIQILVDHLYFLQLDKTQRRNKVLSINNKWFHYVVTIELKHEEFGKNSNISFCK